MEEGLGTREELSQTLFALLDMSENVARIRVILEEDDGEGAEEEPA